MYFRRILFKVVIHFLLFTPGLLSYAQSVPAVPSEIEFASVIVQLTPSGRQRLQQAVNNLYIDRALLLHQAETLNELRPLLDDRLTAQHIPLDFRYVCPPFSETPYDPYAYWGLDKLQAERLHLLINQTVDDRRHILIATDAVLPYLNLLHQQKGHWIKALLQHLDPAFKQPSSASDPNRYLLDVKVPPAIWTVLARKISFEHEQTLLRLTAQFTLLAYEGGGGKTLAELAGRLKINSDRLSPYNTWLLADRVPTTGNFPVMLRLTLEEYLTVKSRLTNKGSRSTTNNSLINNELGFPILRRLEPAVTRQATIFYQINGRRGIQAQLCDNAITLAYYGRLPIPKFLTINDLPAQDIILKPGEVYYLQRKAKRAKIPFHVVQQSQTLWDISAIYGIRLKSLLRFNRVKPSQRVQAGRIVWMQRKRPAKLPVEYQSPPVPDDTRLTDAPATIASDTSPLEDSLKVQPAALPPVVPDPVVSAPSPLPIRRDSLVTAPVEPLKPAPTVPAAITNVPTPITKVHVVRTGQTYYSIARLYGITVSQLCTWNKVSASDPLLIGQELLIDALGPSMSGRKQSGTIITPTSAVTTPTTPLKKVVYYTVKPGETIYRIALNHAITVPDLMRWNGLKNFTIEVGQRLIVSAPGK